MIGSFIFRLKLIQSMLLITAVSMAGSLLLVLAATLIFGEIHHLAFSLSMAAVCPLVLAPPISYCFLTLHKEVEKREQALTKANNELQAALSEVKELSGLLPICSICKKIRDDEGYWNSIELYIMNHSKADFTHSICPTCAEIYYGDLLPAKKANTQS